MEPGKVLLMHCFVPTGVSRGPSVCYTMKIKKAERTVLSVEQAEGVGARVRRSIGRKEVLSSLGQDCHISGLYSLMYHVCKLIIF